LNYNDSHTPVHYYTTLTSKLKIASIDLSMSNPAPDLYYPNPPRPGRSSISLRRGSNTNEISPLLKHRHRGEDAEEDDYDEEEEEEEEIDQTFWGAFRALSANAAPLTIGFLLEACFPLVSTLIAG
jgi:hypothetical protein